MIWCHLLLWRHGVTLRLEQEDERLLALAEDGVSHQEATIQRPRVAARRRTW